MIIFPSFHVIVIFCSARKAFEIILVSGPEDTLLALRCDIQIDEEVRPHSPTTGKSSRYVVIEAAETLSL